MSPATEQLLQCAMALPESERLALAEALLAASEHPTGPEISDGWLAEVQRRSAQIDAGEAVLTPWLEVKRRARARLEGQTGG